MCYILSYIFAHSSEQTNFSLFSPLHIYMHMSRVRQNSNRWAKIFIKYLEINFVREPRYGLQFFSFFTQNTSECLQLLARVNLTYRWIGVSIISAEGQGSTFYRSYSPVCTTCYTYIQSIGYLQNSRDWWTLKYSEIQSSSVCMGLKQTCRRQRYVQWRKKKK